MQEILDKSRPSIIILQADHGPGSLLNWESGAQTNVRERFSIFNAYYFPKPVDVLYKEITPVNTFRIILNCFFGMKYQLLEEKCYYTTWERPYDFKDVTDRVGLKQ